MARQVLNEGLSLTEGVLDKGNLIDLMNVINRSDANFAEVYAGSGGSDAFDGPSIGLVATTKTAAIAELKTLIDAINAVLT